MARAAKPKNTKKTGKKKPAAAKAKPKRTARSKPAPRTVKTVRRDTYTVKDIGAKAVVTAGKGNKVTVTIQEGAQSGELAALFQKVYQQIEARPPSAVATKEEIAETVQRIETEVTEKGEQANESRLQRWMDFLNQMAPDIVDVLLASLGGPATAIPVVLKKVAERARKPAAA